VADVWAEDRQSRIAVDTDNLTWFARRILQELGLEQAELSIVVAGSEEIQRYNREYLGRDRPTNVISFPMNEGEAIVGDATYLGDVILSLDAALAEAEELGYFPEEMLLLYLIHGILHLSGYDHEGVDEAKASEMEAKQMAFLDALTPFLKDYPLVLPGSD
jgi:probable rRNA maturation factor